MFLTLFILNQLFQSNQKPIAILHEPTIQGIVLHDYHQTTGIVLHENNQTTGIVLHDTPVQGIQLHEPAITPVATWAE